MMPFNVTCLLLYIVILNNICCGSQMVEQNYVLHVTPETYSFLLLQFRIEVFFSENQLVNKNEHILSLIYANDQEQTGYLQSKLGET